LLGKKRCETQDQSAENQELLVGKEQMMTIETKDLQETLKIIALLPTLLGDLKGETRLDQTLPKMMEMSSILEA